MTPGLTSGMTLRDQIIRQITQTGPITLADYMTTCLLHPTLGYYTTRDPFGRTGDFVTAPEVSQMFGELVGLALAQTWLTQGAPDHFILAELGPGRGTLMADVLRATAAVPGFAKAASVHMVETSPTLCRIQKQAVPQASHHDSITTLPDGPVYIIANEFFDALPIRQFTREPGGWAETVIGLTGGALTLGRTTAAPLEHLDNRLADTPKGQIIETRPAADQIATEIARRIAQHGGAAIVIDYGGAQTMGDTFQAVANNRFADPLADPGNADLTAHVDFGAIVQAATGAAHAPLTSQGRFLERLGITDRARQLAKNLTSKALDQHIAAHHRLTHPDEMGDLFKVLALHPTGTPPPPGCDP